MKSISHGFGEFLGDTITMVVPLTPSLNEILRQHHMKRYRLRGEYQIAVNACARQALGTGYEKPWAQQVEFSAVRCSRGRRRLDETNLRGGLKLVEDAIVEAGIVPDDGPKYVRWGKVEDRIESMWEDLAGPATWVFIRRLGDDE